MEKELLNTFNKQLLLKDLCARLPYGVNVLISSARTTDSIRKKLNANLLFGLQKSVLKIKPYLFPISSMTEEEKKGYRKACELDTEILSKHPMDGTPFPALYNSQDWLNANHFDIYGLIPMGLANDATGLNIY